MEALHAILSDCGRVWVTNTREGQIFHTEGLCHKVTTSVSTFVCLVIFEARIYYIDLSDLLLPPVCWD